MIKPRVNSQNDANEVITFERSNSVLEFKFPLPHLWRNYEEAIGTILKMAQIMVTILQEVCLN